MKKHITYDEEELKATLNFMGSSVNDIKFWIQLMKEQVEGKRTNIDLSVYEKLVLPTENIERMLNTFNCNDK